MLSILEYSHKLLSEALQHGDYALDGTVGNGHDTSLLAEAVGPDGKVFGFDIQKLAINNTRSVLEERQLDYQVVLFNQGHETIDEVIPLETELSAAIFNLGYLPKGDKTIITLPETTLKAFDGVLKRLKQGGRLVIVVYYGHPGGLEEKHAVENFAGGLDQKEFEVLSYKFINQKNNPPFIIAIEKR